jgi:hypothetical protein
VIHVAGAAFYVVTADIIGSRKHENYTGLAEIGIAGFNARCRSLLEAEFTLYRGDEIQGAIAADGDIVRLIRHLRFHLLGLKLRVGVGAGEIASGLDKKYAWQMDGSAFHYSRAALEKIKSRREPATRFAGERADIWAAVNAFYSLIDTIQNRWSAKQWQAVDAYERAGTYAAAAAELGISPQNVAKRCRAAGWKAVAEAERFLSAYVKEGVR